MFSFSVFSNRLIPIDLHKLPNEIKLQIEIKVNEILFVVDGFLLLIFEYKTVVTFIGSTKQSPIFF